MSEAMEFKLKENEEPSPKEAQIQNQTQQPTNSKKSPSTKKRKVCDTITDNANNTTNQAPRDWEKLFKALQAERVTKAESLLKGYGQEFEEREQLMRTYNQELEQANKKLKLENQQLMLEKQKVQDLESQVKQLQSTVKSQALTIQTYNKVTATTFSNFSAKLLAGAKDDGSLDCDCTVSNPKTKKLVKFRISTVSVANDEKGELEEEGIEIEQDVTILRYQLLEPQPPTPNPLPDFLKEDIEFEPTELPPLLQHVLQALYPETEEDDE